jgi:hypothetical protein
MRLKTQREDQQRFFFSTSYGGLVRVPHYFASSNKWLSSLQTISYTYSLSLEWSIILTIVKDGQGRICLDREDWSQGVGPSLVSSRERERLYSRTLCKMPQLTGVREGESSCLGSDRSERLCATNLIKCWFICLFVIINGWSRSVKTNFILDLHTLLVRDAYLRQKSHVRGCLMQWGQLSTHIWEHGLR